jgi:hypothetical protein
MMTMALPRRHGRGTTSMLSYAGDGIAEVTLAIT